MGALTEGMRVRVAAKKEELGCVTCSKCEGKTGTIMEIDEDRIHPFYVVWGEGNDECVFTAEELKLVRGYSRKMRDA